MTAIPPVDELPPDLEESVMPLVMKVEGEFIGLGTGFVVNQDGLMLTAEHVVSESRAQTVPKLNSEGLWYRAGHFFALYVTLRHFGARRDNPQVYPIPIERAWWLPGKCDVAALKLRVPKINGTLLPLQPFALSPGRPKRGDRICGLGFQQITGKFDDPSTATLGSFKYRQIVTASPGKITDVYTVERDKIFMNYPSFATNAPFPHGMSGGPILNTSDDVCGVISVGQRVQALDGAIVEGDGYGALLWNALLIPVGQGSDKNATLFDLAREGRLGTDASFEQLQVERDDQGLIARISIPVDVPR